jgi:hypothetical protein
MEIVERNCTKCGELKPLSEFHRTRKGTYGHASVCKTCRSRAKPKPEVPEGFKLCRECKGVFPATLEYFKKDARLQCGLANLCKPCASAATRQYYDDHLEERREYNKKRYILVRDKEIQRLKLRYQAHKDEYWAREKKWREENPELYKERSRKYYLATRDYQRQKRKEWRQNNYDEYRAYNEQWAKDNPEKVKAMTKKRDIRRRARERGLPDDFTLADWESCVEYWDRKCAICGRSPDDVLALAADHWIPLKHPNCPGTVITNMVPLCDGKTGCNTTKHARNVVEWLLEKFGEEFANQKLAEVEAFFRYMESTRSKGINNV